MVRMMGEPHARQELHGPLTRRLRRLAVHAHRGLADVLERGQVLEQVELLEDHPDAGPRPRAGDVPRGPKRAVDALPSDATGRAPDVIGPADAGSPGRSRNPKKRPRADSPRGRRARSASGLTRRSRTNCAPVISVVTARYIMPAAANTGKNLKFCATICWLRRVSSFTAMTEASEVPLSTLMASFPMAGRIARIACGKTIRRSVSSGPITSDAAASVWFRFMHRMPPRMTSLLKAASLIGHPVIV